jgi:hypothetical protein
VMDELGIKETSGWGINAFNSNTGRMDAEQKAAWDSVFMLRVHRKIKSDFMKVKLCNSIVDEPRGILC